MKIHCEKIRFWQCLLTATFALVAALWPALPSMAEESSSRAFSTVPAGDSLYRQFDAVRKAEWTSTPSVATAPEVGTMTRYEMALEVAKTIITIRARYEANEHWQTASLKTPLHSLRTMTLELAPELRQFNIDVPATLALISQLEDAQPGHALDGRKPASNADAASETNGGADAIPFRLNADQTNDIELPLTQRLRVYSAVTWLARAASDPLRRDGFRFDNPDGPAGIYSLRSNHSSVPDSWRAGAAYEINQRLRLRASATENAPEPSTLGSRSFGRLSGEIQSGRSVGGGVDLSVNSGVTLSGSVSQLEEARLLGIAGETPFSGTKIEGGIGLTGWQNRVALTAHLSRLVPEDSLALATTAAQFNLGVGLTEQISLRLLYRQLFATPGGGAGDHVLAGGINISF